MNHKIPAITSGRIQKRALFFVFDGGTGIGHLRLHACLAKKLQGRFACLIVTGHRAPAHWMVPEECEYIHLPSWDNLLESRAQYWGRKPFILLDPSEAICLRKDILQGVVKAFAPDVIFVDHLPLGAHEELADIVKDTQCLKYLLTRGILNETTNLRRLILGGKACDYSKLYYHKILVHMDRKVFDFCKQYNISSGLREKTLHVGYVVDRVPQNTIRQTREQRGLKDEDIWVVASAGGGQLGEGLIEACVDLASVHREIVFDIIVGSRSSLPWPHNSGAVVARNNLHLHKEVPYMPYLHASADLVISSAGYNSLMETLQGNAKILSFPSWKDHRDEQYYHSFRLKQFVDIEISTDVSELPAMFEQAIGSLRWRGPRDRRDELDFNGTASIEKIVLEDLQME